MSSVIIGVLVLVPVVGSMLYAVFALNARPKQSRRLTAFGEAPDDLLEN
jgi:hypothetical protein